MSYAKHTAGDQERVCRIKRRGPKNCRVVFQDTGEETLVPKTELTEITPEEAGVEQPAADTDPGETPEPALGGEEVTREMRNFQVTVKELASRLGVSQAKVKEARANGIHDPLVAFEWKQAIQGEESPSEDQAAPAAA